MLWTYIYIWMNGVGCIARKAFTSQQKHKCHGGHQIPQTKQQKYF